MVIDDTTYALSSKNYIDLKTTKNFIIIGGTLNTDMRHYIGWVNRYNGQYKKTAHYTIDKDGKVFQHFDPSLCSEYFEKKSLNSKSVIVLLENEGWLIKDSDKNLHLTWLGDIYNGKEVFEKKWRGQTYWSPYTKEQLSSAIELSKKLCSDLKIPFSAISHNTKIDKLVDYQGVLYKSNFEKHFTDVNPSWGFIEFKNAIEQ